MKKKLTNPPHSRRRKQHGQGMSEYIIITALIAVAAIGIFASFGDVISDQTAAMALEMSGQDGSERVNQARTDANTASTRATQTESLSNYHDQNQN